MAEITERDGTLGKICTRCGVWKPLTEFSPDRWRGNNFQSWCKRCKREHWAENCEEINERRRQRRAENCEEINERRRQRRAENPEKVREQNRQYKARNREKERERSHQHYIENPEYYIIKAAVRKSKTRAAGETVLTVAQWQEILEEWGHRCAYCGKDESQFKGELVREHVIPDSQGGLFTTANIAPSCPQCNIKKGARTPEQAGMDFMPMF